MFAITADPIDAMAVHAAVNHPGAGAIVLFVGVTRDHFGGRAVTRLEYEAWPAMAVPEMQKIGAEIATQWPGAKVAISHRTGVVEIGEPSVVIAVSAPHRAEAYAASRFAIDTLKVRVPVWKKEHYADEGAAWKANAQPASTLGDGEAP